MGVCRPVLLTLLQTTKCYFLLPFSDHSSKIHTRFQTCPLGRNYVIITLIRAQTKKTRFEFAYFSVFLSYNYSFGTQTINTFIHSRSFLENHTRFQSKNPPFGVAHTYTAYIRGYPIAGKEHFQGLFSKNSLN